VLYQSELRDSNTAGRPTRLQTSPTALARAAFFLHREYAERAQQISPPARACAVQVM
jgi:hypothetical protein